jgi:hypothetical protein
VASVIVDSVPLHPRKQGSNYVKSKTCASIWLVIHFHPCLIKHHAIKTFKAVTVKVRAFLTLGEGVQLSVAHSSEQS